MDRPYFEESQYLRNSRWVWYIVVPACLGALAPFAHWYYLTMVLQETEVPSELLITSVLTVVGVVVVMAIILSIKLDTRIDSRGIHYRFFPNRLRWNVIRTNDIQQMEIRDTRKFLQYGIVGFHKNVFQKTIAMTIQGNHHLWLQLRNGQKLILGTQHPYDMNRAIKQLSSTDITH